MSNSISKQTRILVFNKFDKKCAYCGYDLEYRKMHVDHIIPIFRGYTDLDLQRYTRHTRGTNHIENLNPSCSSCNISKSTFSIENWRKELIKKIERLRKESSNFRLLEKFDCIEVKNEKITFYFELFNNRKHE